MPLQLVNAKAESVFSRHKRILGKDRTSQRVAVVNAKCVVAEDPRLQVSLHEIDLTQFSHLERHLVHTGDSGKQEAHVNVVKALLSKKRSELNAP